MNITETIESRVFKNTVLGGLSFFVALLQAIISVPILLHFWGKETYGLWLSFFAGYSLLQTLDFGHQNFVGNKLNILYHTDKDKFKEVLGSSIVISYLIGFIQVLLGLLLVYGGFINDFLIVGASIQEVRNIETALVILLLIWFLFGSASGVIVRIQIPAGMMFQGQWQSIILRLSQFLSLILVAFLGGKILWAALTIAITQSAVFIFTLFYIKKKLPEFFPWWQVWRWKTAFRNFKYSIILTGNIIGQQLGNNGIVLFITKIFEASLVPVFTTLKTITNSALSLTNIFITALLPDIIKFHARGENKKLLMSFDTNWFISGAFINIGIIAVLPFIEDVYIFWTNRQLAFNFPLFLCLASGISFFNFGYGLSAYLYGINDLRSQVYITLARIVLIFMTGYLLAGTLGITGIGVGIILAEITASVFLSLYFVRLQLRKLNSSIDTKTVLTALIPPVIILSDTIILSFTEYNITMLSIFSLILVLLTYFFNWRNLDYDVKEKVKFLFKHYNPIVIK